MKVVEARLVPWTRPLSNAAHVPTQSRRGACLVLVDDSGRRGVGDIAPLPGFSKESLDHALADASRWTTDLLRCPWVPRLDAIAALTSRLTTPSARFAADSAMLELAAAARGATVARLLRPYPPAAVHRQAVISCAQDVAAAVAEGYGALKLKVGRRPLSADLEEIQALRRAHPAIRLRVDANGAWDRETAGRAVDLFARHAVELLEQPLNPSDLEGSAALRGHGVAIALDEAARTVADIDRIADARAADAVVLKPTLCGGFFETLSMAQRAQAHGMRVILSHALESHAGQRALTQIEAAMSGSAMWGSGIDTDRCFADAAQPREEAAA